MFGKEKLTKNFLTKMVGEDAIKQVEELRDEWDRRSERNNNDHNMILRTIADILEIQKQIKNDLEELKKK